MIKSSVLVILCTLALSCHAETYFKEEFGDGWESRWVQSEHDSGYGKFVASAGKHFGDEERDTGLQTSQDAKFYSIGTKIETPFSNKGKTLVIQFTVKHEQGIDCGGGYLKIGPSTVDLKDFHGESPYNVMFGPDICGATKRTHVIFNYKGENKLRTEDLRCDSDESTHLYTLVVKPDQTYDVMIDQKSIGSGNLVDDWSFLAPKEIEDPAVSKPKDWVDEPMMADPEDKKPEDYDDIPQFIPDPEAEKPDDWDDEDDGEWEAPTIDNPEFKGEWKPKMIDNPEYKGEWVHPKIPNPDYAPDDEIYAFSDFGFVGIDIWQVKSGSIFDNILITDSLDEANDHADATFNKLVAEEKKKIEAAKAAEKEKADEERAKRDEEIKDMEDSSDDAEKPDIKHDDL